MNGMEYFNDVAEDWDRMRQGFFSDRVREKALGVADVRSGGFAADLGAGTGFMTEALVGAGVQVIAVDGSPKMIDVLNRKFASSSAVDSRLGEAERLPIMDRSVDDVFANMYLHHVDDPLSAIREMKRILKPGGRVVITDLEKHDFDWLRTEHHDRWMGFYLSDVRHWLDTAGFSNIIVGPLSGETCRASSCCCAGEDAAAAIFVATGTA